jgi:enamine deaminase RidA (YjgF/YER057c/UK114 family)
MAMVLIVSGMNAKTRSIASLSVIPVALAVAISGGCEGARARAEGSNMNRTGSERGGAAAIQHLNPETLHSNPAYSQGVLVTGQVRTIYVGGQNAVDKTGAVVGKNDLGRQTEVALQNVRAVLAAGGASFANVIKWNIHVVAGPPLEQAFAAYQRLIAGGAGAQPGVVTATRVAGLAVPDCLIEIDAIAVVP